MDHQPEVEKNQTEPKPTPQTQAPSEPLPPHPAFATVVSTKKSRALLWILVFVIIMSGGVYATYYWQHQKLNTAQTQLSSATSSVSSLDQQLSSLQKKQSSISTTTTTGKYTITQGVSFVQSTYQTYLAALTQNLKTPGPAILTSEATIKAAFTPSLYTTLQKAAQLAYDPVLCSQVPPTSLTAEASTTQYSDTTSAIVAVGENHATSTPGIFVTVDLQTLKISAITCSATVAS